MQVMGLMASQAWQHRAYAPRCGRRVADAVRHNMSSQLSMWQVCNGECSSRSREMGMCCIAVCLCVVP
jgi:hypothetical protein